MYIDVYLIKLFTLYKYDENFPRYLLLINMGVNVRFYSTSGFTAHYNSFAHILTLETVRFYNPVIT